MEILNKEAFEKFISTSVGKIYEEILAQELLLKLKSGEIELSPKHDGE